MVTYIRANQRRGFSLIELLVVIAIIGMLVGLLLSAVQAGPGMDSRDLTPEQAVRLAEQVRRHLAQLHKLRTRLDRRGFPGDDPLRQRVERAYDAVHRLSVELHYRSCTGGVWRERA